MISTLTETMINTTGDIAGTIIIIMLLLLIASEEIMNIKDERVLSAYNIAILPLLVIFAVMVAYKVIITANELL